MGGGGAQTLYQVENFLKHHCLEEPLDFIYLNHIT